MFRSIRNHILIPLIAIQGAAVAVVAAVAATTAAQRSERQIVDRLNGVIEALGHGGFPYTRSVLDRMRGLSGAHFTVYGPEGTVTESTLPTLTDLPPAARSAPSAERLDSLGKSPVVASGGTRYFAVPVRPLGAARGTTLLVLYSETSWRQARWEAAAPPLAIGLGTLALMAAVTGWVAHRISARIRQVQGHVARIAAGDFQGFDPGPQSDEVQDLAKSVNGMCAQLRQMHQTIQQSERTRLLAQLAAGLAHQLRNSLTGARMSVQLHARRFPAEEGDETLDVALRQLAMTEEHVKALLSLGRVEPRPHAPCELGRLLGDVTHLVGPSCRHAKVGLRHHPADGALEVVADEPGLRAAVLNLAMNAIEAAGPGGDVRLVTSLDDGEVTIEVSDNGPGPPPEVSATLLDPFVTSKPEGVGIGLTLAHRVAAEHGGRLSWARDAGRTRFRLTLPRSPATAEEPR